MSIEAAKASGKGRYQPALGGMRGYGFLAVFIGHYFGPVLLLHQNNFLVNVLSKPLELAWLAVPGFFVLSGYLIGGILSGTLGREGYFKVFYARRILRVFPVYYLTLLVVAFIATAQGIHLKSEFWWHFLYLHNLLRGYTALGFVPPFGQLVHLWSLAIEEQFYLTWPLIVWLAKDRKTLLKVVAVLIAASFVLRLISPLIHLTASRSYVATPTRADSILMGVGLALMGGHWLVERIRPYATFIAIVGAVTFIISWSTHLATPATYLRVAFEIPLANVTVLAILIAVLDEKTVLARLCSARWAGWLGSMSYAMYVFHYLYQHWFLFTFRPWLQAYMPELWATLFTAILGFALTLGLGMLSFKFIELPAANLKKYFKYGPVRRLRESESTPGISTPAQEMSL
jgi:peptidoglycan/LPS O-acetylase OafA/YrhL